MKFGTESNAERTQKYGGSKYKMTYVRPYIQIHKHSRFFHFYPCKCLARYTRSPITSNVLAAVVAMYSETVQQCYE